MPVTAPLPVPNRRAAAPAYAGVDHDYDAFAHEPPFRPRRNPARRWTIAAVTAGALMLIATLALVFGNLPSFAAMLGLPLGGGDTPLKFVNLKKPDRRDLPNGSELFAIGGQVKNPTGAAPVGPRHPRRTARRVRPAGLQLDDQARPAHARAGRHA